MTAETYLEDYLLAGSLRWSSSIVKKINAEISNFMIRAGIIQMKITPVHTNHSPQYM